MSRALLSSTSTRLTALLLCLLTLSSSLHLSRSHTQDNDKQYDKNSYFLELSGIQSKFKKDINSIKDQFTRINLQLNSTNITASNQVILLQETLAEERDALFNIQKYLAVPFALRSCECLNLTQDKKLAIQAQIKNASESIEALQKSLGLTENGSLYENPKCPQGKCPAVQQIHRQISELKNYVKIMNATITSECCKIVNYFYRDNLVDSNYWVYGNTTEKDYRLGIFEQSKVHNLTQCLKGLPFANIKDNECFSCPDELPYFNLGTRKCFEGCKYPMIMDRTIKNCDYNRTCTDGKYFNTVTLQCEKNQGTQSSCPKDKPFWDRAILSCQKCPSDKPYYDFHVDSCRACTENEKWSVADLACVSKDSSSGLKPNCPPGAYYNTAAKVCQLKPTNPGSGSFSQCPPETPFWSQTEYNCYKCPQETSYYNITSNNCQACPTGTAWSSLLNTCTSSAVICQPTESYSADTGKCQAKPVSVSCQGNQVYNSATKKCQAAGANGQIGLCPPDQPYWNVQEMVCEQCNQTTPKWNVATKACESCANGWKWVSALGECKAVTPSCPSGKRYNPTTKACENIKCTGDQPLLNPTNNKCESCPTATVFNLTTAACERKTTNDTGGQPSLNGNTSVCGSKEPYWNAERLNCEKCPSGTTLNKNSRNCEGPTHLSLRVSQVGSLPGLEGLRNLGLANWPVSELESATSTDDAQVPPEV